MTDVGKRFETHTDKIKSAIGLNSSILRLMKCKFSSNIRSCKICATHNMIATCVTGSISANIRT